MLLAQRYRTSEILGHGGMGEVYRGRDELLGRPVAVKLLRPDLCDPFAAARFQREAHAAAVVRDPHVVAVYDFGHCNGEYYLVMELMEGHSVAHELALHGPFDPERAIGIVRQVAAGLQAAHRHDIVHRDIKPENLLIDVDGSVKIADFGIAGSPTGAVTPVSATAETSGPILGTSLYLAPERALGHPATPASDVYALGCVLYQLLTGHPPFQGGTPTEIMSQHVEAAPNLQELPLPVAALVRRMLAKDPEQRPATTEIAAWTFATAANTPTAELAPPRSRRHHRTVFATLAALLAAGSAVLAGVLVTQDADTPLAPADMVPADMVPAQPPRQTAPTPPPAVRPKPTIPTVTITKAVTPAVPKARPSSPRATQDDRADRPGKGKQKPGKH